MLKVVGNSTPLIALSNINELNILKEALWKSLYSRRSL